MVMHDNLCSFEAQTVVLLLFFLQCKLALKADGLFLAAILGGETLKLSNFLLYIFISFLPYGLHF